MKSINLLLLEILSLHFLPVIFLLNDLLRIKQGINHPLPLKIINSINAVASKSRPFPAERLQKQ